MTLPALLWAVTTAFLWRSGSGRVPSREMIPVLYPKIPGSGSIPCDCLSSSCDGVYWYRSLTSNNNLQFLAYYNNAGRSEYGDGVERDRFKPAKGGSGFELIINNLSEGDAGFYSCVLKNRGPEDGWRPGVLLRPGVTPPPPLPKTTPKTMPKKKAKKKTHPVSGCHIWMEGDPEGGCMTLVLWLLVGVCASLTVALISTLYYFSRLPKKCRHHFVKKTQAMQ